MKLSNIIIISTFSFLILTPQILFAKQLDVPFTPQAPQGRWTQPWQDYCEEATIVMVNNFYLQKSLTPTLAIKQLNELGKTKERFFGFSLDESAEKIVSMINSFFSYEAYVVTAPTIQQIKNELDAQRPVILPAYGKALYNPYFFRGGPDYHTLVISGYDDDTQEFITQEPGTRQGKNYRYSYQTIMDAMHNYTTPNNTKYGTKVAIFTTTQLTNSFSLDIDNDGLTKEQELREGTILWLSDSDGDGFSDGQEVANGYSPIRKTYKAKTGDLVKSFSDPKVYFIKNNTRHHIQSEEIFLKNNWNWNSILSIDNNELQKIIEGEPISK